MPKNNTVEIELECANSSFVGEEEAKRMVYSWEKWSNYSNVNITIKDPDDFMFDYYYKEGSIITNKDNYKSILKSLDKYDIKVDIIHIDGEEIKASKSVRERRVVFTCLPEDAEFTYSMKRMLKITRNYSGHMYFTFYCETDRDDRGGWRLMFDDMKPANEAQRILKEWMDNFNLTPSKMFTEYYWDKLMAICDEVEAEESRIEGSEPMQEGDRKIKFQFKDKNGWKIRCVVKRYGYNKRINLDFLEAETSCYIVMERLEPANEQQKMLIEMWNRYDNEPSHKFNDWDWEHLVDICNDVILAEREKVEGSSKDMVKDDKTDIWYDRNLFEDYINHIKYMIKIKLNKKQLFNAEADRESKHEILRDEVYRDNKKHYNDFGSNYMFQVEKDTDDIISFLLEVYNIDNKDYQSIIGFPVNSLEGSSVNDFTSWAFKYISKRNSWWKVFKEYVDIIKNMHKLEKLGKDSIYELDSDREDLHQLLKNDILDNLQNEDLWKLVESDDKDEVREYIRVGIDNMAEEMIEKPIEGSNGAKFTNNFIYNGSEGYVGIINLLDGKIEKVANAQQVAFANGDHQTFFYEWVKRLADESEPYAQFYFDHNGKLWIQEQKDGYDYNKVRQLILEQVTFKLGKVIVARCTDKDGATWEDKEFWIGCASSIDGKIEEVHTFEEAEANDFHHSFYFSKEAQDRMKNGESEIFWIDDGKIDGLGMWRDTFLEESEISRLSKLILEQITILPCSNMEAAEMSSPLVDNSSNGVDPSRLSDNLNIDNIKTLLYDENFSTQVIELLKSKGIKKPEDLFNLPTQMQQEVNTILNELPKSSKSNSLNDTISDLDVRQWIKGW